jgi:hypothetical protein
MKIPAAAGFRRQPVDSRYQSFSWNSQAEHEMNMPPEVLRSRSFTRFTIRVGLPHLGQSVLFEVSIIFSRPAVLATLAMVDYSPVLGFPRLGPPPGSAVEENSGGKQSFTSGTATE